MKFLKRIVFITVIFIGVVYFLTNPNLVERDQTELNQKEMLLEKKQEYDKANPSSLDTDLITWVGKQQEDLVQAFGDPIREDMSRYGYTWFIYQEDHSEYILFGIEDGEIVTAYAAGKDINLGSLQIGQSYEEIHDELSFTNELEFQTGTSKYTFKLYDEDITARPLVKLDNDLFMQYYFDTFTESLVAVRILTGNVLLLHQDYEITYRGNLPTEQPLSDDDWEIINQGQEQQIFELTNVIRNQYNHPILSWVDDVSEAALHHSKDMAVNDYFSHETLSGEGLTERLDDRDITYQLAGENIAANYPDALATVAGWINSEGHRESLFNEQFTHLGVGVYELYYTQNFLQR